MVLALPRGGVVVAEPIARRLAAPLGLVLVRKVRTPGYYELAMGAVALAAGHVAVTRHDAVVADFRITEAEFDAAVAQERAGLDEQAGRYGPPDLDLSGRTVVVVDDGLATGMTMGAALEAVSRAGATRRVLAVPVASEGGLHALRAEAVVCPLVPSAFRAVSTWYRHFDQTSDSEVVAALSRAGQGWGRRSPDARPAGAPPDGSPNTAR